MTTQLTLYDDLPDAIDLPNRILYMRRVHGPNNADRCGTCAHFLQVYHFAKCAQYGSSALAPPATVTPNDNFFIT